MGEPEHRHVRGYLDTRSTRNMSLYRITSLDTGISDDLSELSLNTLATGKTVITTGSLSKLSHPSVLDSAETMTSVDVPIPLVSSILRRGSGFPKCITKSGRYTLTNIPERRSVRFSSFFRS